MFGYSPPPEEPNLLCRDVWRFVQRLDLSTPIKNPRRDFSNGFLAAEMMGRFYPGDVQMHSYQNGTSEPVKRDNWEQVCRVAQKHDLQLPSHLVEGTIKGAPGAAAGLLEFLYEQLTGKKVQKLDPKQLPAGMDAAMAAAAGFGGASADLAEAEPQVSFGEPAAGADSGALRTIKAAGSVAPTIEFGAVHTQQAGTAAEIRRKFAGQ